MTLDDWISCPDGCEAPIRKVTLPDSRIGLQCVACGRKVEEPVRRVELDYKSVDP
jgi:hypothetical protein